MDDVYRRLAEHLDRLPAGFPPTESGVELRILKRLFTPEQAEIAASLSAMPEPVPVIAERLGRDEAELAEALEEMARSGLIYRMRKNGKTRYMAAQFVIGIWEYHVNDLDPELIRDFNEYVPHLMKESWQRTETKQLRVIPIAKSISARMHIMPYDVAEELIRNQSKIVVAPCICRKEHAMMGKGCGKPLETCLVFGGGAYFYEENGLGRSITADEALEILHGGIQEGLVLQPGNSQKPMNICMCCGDCCQILKNLNTMDAPARVVCSNFTAQVDSEACVACGNCEEICQMDAIAVDETAVVDPDRCIGCGLCVSVCDTDAMSLLEKPSEQQVVPPANTVETYLKMAQERGLI